MNNSKTFLKRIVIVIAVDFARTNPLMANYRKQLIMLENLYCGDSWLIRFSRKNQQNVGCHCETEAISQRIQSQMVVSLFDSLYGMFGDAVENMKIAHDSFVRCYVRIMIRQIYQK